ncbi:MAG: hypothetical protein M1832_006171 [Thelocarpon impressellum]|nr:MAG: hypothetical protein M1832_006171 [Thelocarpon impressellum]
MAQFDSIQQTPYGGNLERIPPEMFSEILANLHPKELHSFSRASKALYNHSFVQKALFQEPFGRADFAPRAPFPRDRGMDRWHKFKVRVSSYPRLGIFIQKLALPHECTMQDFAFLDQYCHNITSLDLGGVYAKSIIPWRTDFTWRAVQINHPAVFERLRHLTVFDPCRNLTGEFLDPYRYPGGRVKWLLEQSSLDRVYGYRDEDGHTLQTLVKNAPNLRTLVILGGSPSDGWDLPFVAEDLTNAIIANAGPSLKRLELHGMTWTIRNVGWFLAKLTTLRQLKTVGIDLGDFLAKISMLASGTASHYFNDSSESEPASYRADQLMRDLFDLSSAGRWDVKCCGQLNSKPLKMDCFNFGSGTDVALLTWFAETYGWEPLLCWKPITMANGPALAAFPENVLVQQSRREEAYLVRGLDSLLTASVRPITLAMQGGVRFDRMNVLDCRSMFFDSRWAPTTSLWSLNDIGPCVHRLLIDYQDDSSPLVPPTEFPQRLHLLVAQEAKRVKQEILGWTHFWDIRVQHFTQLTRVELHMPREIFEGCQEIWRRQGALMPPLPGTGWSVIAAEDMQSVSGPLVNVVFWRAVADGWP